MDLPIIDCLELQLAGCRSYDDCFRVSLWLKENWKNEHFLPLFDFAINSRNPYVSTMSAACLVMMEPDSPVSCQQLLRCIHKSRWQGDTATVPMYLITQFGKQAISNELSRLMQPLSEIEQSQTPLARVEYWLRFSTLDMAERLVYWQWDEERGNLASMSKVQ